MKLTDTAVRKAKPKPGEKTYSRHLLEIFQSTTSC
jgi:hypothetical protein